MMKINTSDILLKKEEYLGQEVVCSGILIYENEQFYINSTLEQDAKLLVTIDEDLFTYIGYIQLKRLGTQDSKRDVRVVGNVKQTDNDLEIMPTHIIVYGYIQDIHYFQRGVNFAKAFPSKIEYQDVIKLTQKKQDTMLSIPIEATLIGEISQDRSLPPEFYLGGEIQIEIDPPSLVYPEKSIDIADEKFIHNFTSIVSMAVPSPGWVNRVRLVADIIRNQNGTYEAYNIQDVLIQITNNIYKKMK